MIANTETRYRTRTRRAQNAAKATLSADEARSLVNLLPQPAFLVERTDGTVLFANSRAVGLTAYSRDELEGAPLEMLFPAQNIAELWEPDGDTASHSLALARSRGEPSAVLVRALPVGQTRFVWIVEPAVQVENNQREQARRQNIWKHIRNLATVEIPGSLTESLAHLLAVGGDLCGAPILAAYFVDDEHLRFRQSAAHGEANLLPVEIAASDFAALQAPYLWTSGKRPSTGLHRAGRVNGLHYIASTPIGSGSAVTGLLVAAAQQPPAGETLLAELDALAAQVALIGQTHILLENLDRQIQSQAFAIASNLAIREAAQDGVLIFSPELTLVDMNPSAEQMLGYASHEVRGLPMNHILIGAEQIQNHLRQINYHKLVHTLGEMAIFRRDGQPLLARVRALALLREEELANWAIFLQDLSQEEQFRIRTQQLEQRALLGEVTAVFAHEVRNPINNISTGLQLMAFNLPEDDPNREMIGRLQQDCDRLAELMKSVLSFARPMDLKLEPLDVGLLLRRLLERWHPRLAKARVNYQLHCENGSPPILGDARALEQVFTNLISNAIQAMQEHGGSLTVKVRQDTDKERDPHVQISISDTGIGIPEEIRERIFEPFFTTHAAGTGLGLAITRRIVTAHRGNIHVTSIPGGTVFQLEFPAARPATEDESEPRR